MRKHLKNFFKYKRKDKQNWIFKTKNINILAVGRQKAEKGIENDKQENENVSILR